MDFAFQVWHFVGEKKTKDWGIFLPVPVNCGLYFTMLFFSPRLYTTFFLFYCLLSCLLACWIQHADICQKSCHWKFAYGYYKTSVFIQTPYGVGGASWRGFLTLQYSNHGWPVVVSPVSSLNIHVVSPVYSLYVLSHNLFHCLISC